MSYEIEIESQDEDMVVFYINETPYTAEIETQIVTQEYPISFNSFNDKINYAEEDVIYYYVKANTAGIVTGKLFAFLFLPYMVFH